MYRYQANSNKTVLKIAPKKVSFASIVGRNFYCSVPVKRVMHKGSR